MQHHMLLDDLTFKQTTPNTNQWLLDERIGRLFSPVDAGP